MATPPATDLAAIRELRIHTRRLTEEEHDDEVEKGIHRGSAGCIGKDSRRGDPKTPAASLPEGTGADCEWARKRLYMVQCCILGMLVIAGFALRDLILGASSSFVVQAAVCGLLGLYLQSMRVRPLSNAEIRLAIVTLVGLVIYEYAVGSGDGSVLLWLFLFPVVIFFVLGRREGLVWSAAMLIAVLVLMAFPHVLGGSSSPSAGLRMRLPLSFAAACIFAYGYERFREKAAKRADEEAQRLQAEHGRLVEAQERLERAYLEIHESYEVLEDEIEQRKRTELEKQSLIDDLLAAAAEVRRLHGLLPICSSCKKIRDDGGYWKQLEEYFHTHSDVVFSHGMCPECLERLYPEDAISGEA